jgi:putative membrane protein
MRNLSLILFILVIASATLPADADGHATSVGDVLEEIRGELDLDEGERIDPAVVPPELLEELGDAVMAEMHPDADVHAWMDEMMGGEGSESLASAHRWMGYRYLTGGYGRGFRGGMMHGGMMGPGMMGRGFARWGLMGNPDIDPSAVERYASPEEIVKRRYARGEISRDEYLRLMEDLSGEQ